MQSKITQYFKSIKHYDTVNWMQNGDVSENRLKPSTAFSGNRHQLLFSNLKDVTISDVCTSNTYPFKIPQRKYRYCSFCYKNKEAEYVFGTHVLKNEKGKIICPVLRKYTCPTCGATGDNAHTVDYCRKTSRPMSECQLTDSLFDNTLQAHARSNIERDKKATFLFDYGDFVFNTYSLENPYNNSFKSDSTFDSEMDVFQNPNGQIKQATAKISFCSVDCEVPSVDCSSSPSFECRKISKYSLCKFCRKCGRSVEIYTGHNLKNSFGCTECPFLKRITCFFCGRKGHTKKYCPDNDYSDLIKMLEL